MQQSIIIYYTFGNYLSYSSKALMLLYSISSKFMSNGPKSLNLYGSSDEAHAANDLPQKLPIANNIFA